MVVQTSTCSREMVHSSILLVLYMLLSRFRQRIYIHWMILYAEDRRRNNGAMTGNRQCSDLKSEREEAEQQQKIRLGSGWVMQTKYFYAKAMGV